jgi:hypothetical protein
LYQDFSVSFGSFVTQPTGFVILWGIIVEIILFLGFAYGFSYLYLKQHLRKLG